MEVNIRRILLSYAWMIMFMVSAEERTALWPEGKIPNKQSHQIEITKQGAKAATKKGMPYLSWYEAPANKNGGCMILVPGGGYLRCGGDWIDAVAKRFTEEGFVCVRLTYRTPRPKGLPIYQSAWQDGQRAVRLVRSEAQKRGFNPEKIGVMGASAGAHLTTLLATSSLTSAYDGIDQYDEIPSHINWAVLACPAYMLSDGLTKPNSRGGDAIDVKLSNAFKFDKKTCPMALFHGGTDHYSPNGSIQLYRQLRRMKIPTEIHLFADRGHVFWGDATKDNDAAAYDLWGDRVCEFFRQMNYDGKLGKEVELLSRYTGDDARGEYSKEEIWPEGKIPDMQAHHGVPFIEWHHPKKRTSKAIQIIFSGGGYNRSSTDNYVVAPPRRFLNEKGITVVTLKYRVRPKNGLAKHTPAWQDLQRAIRVVRSQAKAKGLDPDRIGIMGSSAGGHLSLMGATSSKSRSYWPIDKLDKIPCKVQWAIAIHPAYSLTDGVNKPNKMGGNSDDARLVPEFSFDLATCPMLFIHGDADGHAAMNSVKAWEQLRRMGIQSDLHTLAKRKHNHVSAAAPGTGSYSWMNRIWEFLNHKGFNK